MFRVECANDCGIEHGPPVIVAVPNIPMVPTCQVEYWENCQFKITWQKNHLDYNPAIEKYQVSINGRLHKPCSYQSWENSCVVDMSVLLRQPFSARVGDPISCSVMAKNTQGWS
jgi:hypothetical protein